LALILVDASRSPARQASPAARTGLWWRIAAVAAQTSGPASALAVARSIIATATATRVTITTRPTITTATATRVTITTRPALTTATTTITTATTKRVTITMPIAITASGVASLGVAAATR